MYRYLLVFLSLAVIPCLSHATTIVPLNMSSGRMITGQQYQVEIKVPEQVKVVKTPSDKNILVQLAGMGPYTSTSIDLNTGQKVTERAIIYSYIIIPRKTGNLTLGEFIFQGKKDEYRTQPVSIQVFDQQQVQSMSRRIEYSMVMQILTPVIKKNQPVVVEARVYAQTQDDLNIGFQESEKLVAHQCMYYDISETLTNSPVFSARANGVELFYRIVKRYVFFPTDTGNILVQSPIINAYSAFGIYRLPVDNFYIPVPPDNSTGLVYRGDMKLESEYTKLPLRAGDSMDIHITMQGNGNLKVLSNPYAEINIPGLNIFLVESSIKPLHWDGQEMQFEQFLTYRISASKPGDYIIPELKIRYQDLQGRPREQVLKEIKLTFLPGTGSTLSKNMKWNSLNRSEKVPVRKRLPAWIWVLSCILLLLPLAGWFWGRHSQRLKQDPLYARKTGWEKEMESRLKICDELYSQGKIKQAASEAYKLIRDFLILKFGMDQSWKDETILERISGMVNNQELMESTRKLMSSWKMTAYSGVEKDEGAGNALSIRNLLENWKKIG